MDPMLLISLIPTVLRIVPFVLSTLGQGLSINTIGNVVQNPDVKSVFAMLGAFLFPAVRPEFQASAAIVASYSPEYVKKVQNAMNVLMDPVPNLDVDGHYGKLSVEVVKQYQKKRGLEYVDGFAGDKTWAMIAADLLKHDEEAKTVPEPVVTKV